MKHFFTFLFLIILLIPTSIAAVSNDSKAGFSGVEKETVQYPEAPASTLTATIHGTNNVCLNDPAPSVTFHGSGGMSPYTFTYQLNGGTNLFVTSASGDSINLTAPTGTSGTFVYRLINVKDFANQQAALTDSITVTVGTFPDATLNSIVDLGTVNGKPGFKYCSGEADVLFTNGSTTVGTNKNYDINWGDGTPDFLSTAWGSVTHHYMVGLWTLTYIVTGTDGCITTKQYTILVNSNAKVSFGSDNNSKDICLGSDYFFRISNTESNPDSTVYTVTYNDGTAPIIYKTNPPALISHTFNKSSCGVTSITATGTYINSFSATITVSNPCGSDAVTVAPIYVSTPPVAKLDLLSPKICANIPACFTDNSTGNEVTSQDPTCKIPKRVWKITPSTGFTLTSGSLGDNFGNTTPSSWISGSQVLCPKFTTSGNYTIKLIVGNRCAIDSTVQTVFVEPALIPLFQLDKNEGCAPLAVVATNKSDTTNNHNIAYLWEVAYTPGNCGTSPETWSFTSPTDKNSVNPSFNFVTPGMYTIKLSLTNSCGTVSTSKMVQVTKPPTVIINNLPDYCDVATINPSAIVDGCAPLATPLTYSWSFPGGNPATSSLVNPGSITYNTIGTDTVYLKVTNADCGAATTAFKVFTIHKTPTVNDTPDLEVCKGTTITGIKFSGSGVNTTYNWSMNTAIGLSPLSGTDSIPSFITVNNGIAPLVATITVTPVANGCTGTAHTFRITVNPSPKVVFSIPNQSICSGDNTNAVKLSSTTTSGVSFSWTTTIPPGITGATITTGSDTIPVQTLANSTNAPIVLKYKATALYNGIVSCTGAVYTYSMTVNPKPVIAVNPATIICSGSAFSVTPATGGGNMVPAGTTYTWPVPLVSPAGALAGGSQQITGQAAISQTLTNLTAIAATATYTVTPKSGGCTGIPFTVVVTVNPTPSVTVMNDMTLCTGQVFNQPLAFTGSMPGTVYTWTNSDATIGLSSSGTGTLPTFTTKNTTSNPVASIITVTPTLNGCSGISKLFKITVIPVLTVNAVSDVMVCHNQASVVIPLSGTVPGTTFSWVNPKPGIGLKSSGTGDIPAFTAINTGTVPVIDTITVTPSNALGCAGVPMTFTMTVNPFLVVSFSPHAKKLCSNEKTVPVTLSSTTPTGVNFNWTAAIPSGITGATALTGVNLIPAQAYINTTNAPLEVVYSATASFSGNVTCGSAYFDTITILPTPVIQGVWRDTICSGASFKFTPVNGSGSIVPAGTTFTWSAPGSNPVGAVTEGSEQLSPVTSVGQTLTNMTSEVATATYTVTPNSGGCVGNPFDVIVTVRPIPTVDAIKDTLLCAGVKYTQLQDFSGTVSGTAYSWKSDTGAIGIPLSGTGRIPSFTTINTTASPITATITVTPEANGCTGSSKIFTITVDPVPAVIAIPDVVVCPNETTARIKLNSPVSGTTFSWVSSNDSIGLAHSGNGDIPAFTAIHAGTGSLIDTITVIPSNAQGCQGAPVSFTITIHPLSTLNAVPDITLCNNQISGVIPFTGNETGITFSWVNPNPAIGLKATGIGDISAFKAINNGPVQVMDTITVTPVNASGCAGTPQSFTITVNPNPTVQLTNLVVCDSTQVAMIKFTGNVPNTTYNWKFDNTSIGLTQTGGIDSIPSFRAINNGNVPITAIFTVTPGSNGCTGTDNTFSITVNPLPVVTFSLINQTVCSGSSTSPVQLKSNVAGSTFRWTAVEPTGISGVIPSGTGNQLPQHVLVNTTSQPVDVIYSVRAVYTNGESCEGIPVDYRFTVNPAPAIQPVKITICNGGTLVINPSDGNGNIVPSTTRYTWGSPVISPAKSITGFFPESAAQDSMIQALTNKTNQTAIVTYTVTPVSGTCTGNPFTVEVTVNQTPDIVFSLPNQVISTGKTSLPVTPAFSTGNVKYTWTVDIPSGITGQTKPTSNQIPAQTLVNLTNQKLTVIYTVTSEFADGSTCAGTTASYLITVNPTIVTNYTVSDYNGYNVNVAGGNDGWIDVTVNGGSGSYKYTWTAPDGTILKDSTNHVSGLPAGNYTLTVTDGVAVPVTLNITLTEPSTLKINETHRNINCYGESTGAIHIDVFGGAPFENIPGIYTYNYSWICPDGTVIKSKDLSNIAAGTYVLKVTDATGYFNVLNVVITQPEKLVLTLTTKPISCYGSNDASIKFNIAGGTKPYQILWNNLGSGTFQDNLSPGDYTVTAIDSLGCSQTAKVTISESQFSINPAITPVTCFGANDGSINLNISGGVPPVSISWDDDPAAGNVRNRLNPGTYNVTLMDGTSCTFTKKFIILEPLKLESTASITDAFGCNTPNSGSVNLLVTGGTPPYTYNWSNGAVTEKLNQVAAGDYSVTVTDLHGCMVTESYRVKRQTPLSIGITTTNSFDCLTKIVSQISSAEITGGVPPYQLMWSSGTVSGVNNDTMVTTRSGMVQVQVTDGLGCMATSSFNVDIRNPGIKYQVLFCNQYSFQFNAVTPTDNEDYSYSWDFGDGGISSLQNVVHAFNTSGSHNVRLILKSSSCTSYYEQVISVEPGPMLAIDKSPTFCAGDSVVVHVTGAKSYQWNDGTKQDSIIIKRAGEYIVTGTSGTGCTSTLAFTASHYDATEYTIHTDRDGVTNDNIPLHLWSEVAAGSEYYWDFDDGKTDQGNDITHIFDITRDGYYDVKLRVVNDHGCIQNVTKRIWITQSKVPNVFTPNGDGKNDVFMKNWKIQVYNRNGILIYEGKDGWDGTRNGKPVSNDTYFFVVYYSTGTGTKTNTGFVTVIR